MDIVAGVRTRLLSAVPLVCDVPIVVAVSGGADSLCLLHVLHTLAPELDLALHVVHVEHGIRGEASLADAHFVRDYAVSLGLTCEIISVDAPAAAQVPGISLEEAARQLRYAALAEAAIRVGASVLLTAHHADDQVETVVMHWLRGSALGGMRGMVFESNLDPLSLAVPGAEKLRLLRPLLGVWRADIEAYCQQYHLAPRIDETNADMTYFRNRLRHELLPLLETYNPNFKQGVWQASQAFAGDYEIISEVVDNAWEKACISEGEPIILSAKVLQTLSDAVVRAMVRRAIFNLQSTLRDVGWVHAEAALQVIRSGQTGAHCTLPGGLELAVYYDKVIIAEAGQAVPKRLLPQYHGDPRPIFCSGMCELAEGWVLQCELFERCELPVDWQSSGHPLTAFLDADALGELRLRVRRPGDRMRPLGMAGRRKVKDVLIDEHVPQPLRDGLPLIESGDEIVWLAGVRQGQAGCITESTRRVLVLRLVRRSA